MINLIHIPLKPKAVSHTASMIMPTEEAYIRKTSNVVVEHNIKKIRKILKLQ